MTFDPTTATVEDLRKAWTEEFELSAEQITWLLDYTERLGKVAAPERLVELITALEFYADPMSYFAIGFFPDHPAGEFMDDFSETELGMKPGKLARATLYLDAEPAKPPKRVEVRVAIEQLKLAPEVKDCLMAIWTEVTQAAEIKIAKLEAERDRRVAALPRFDRGDDPANEVCQGCGKHISRHYGMTEYRCNPMEDDDARA